VRLAFEHSAFEAGEDELAEIGHGLADAVYQLAFMESVEDNKKGDSDKQQGDYQAECDSEAQPIEKTLPLHAPAPWRRSRGVNRHDNRSDYITDK